MSAQDKNDSSDEQVEGAETPNAPYMVLARKYRPSDFSDLIGQEAMVQTLSNAFDLGRIHHAYILTGVRGVGKTTTARILARALNYVGPNGAAPSLDLSEKGENCQAIMDGQHVDVMEMDAASNTSIDDVREIIDSVKYGPVSAPFKVYIIDEVHMLSRQAFNGLLKTLEEPPPYVKFIFATTEINKVPVTILSRCQRFDLRRIPADAMTEYLGKLLEKEGVTAESEALAMIVRAGEGSARDCLSLLDQAIAFDAKNVRAENVQAMLGLADRGRIVDLFKKLVGAELEAALLDLRDLYDSGAEPQTIIADLANFTHAITRMKLIAAAADDPALTPLERSAGQELAAKLDVRSLTRLWQIFQQGLSEVARAQNAIQTAEMVLIRVGYAADLPTPDELIKQIEAQKNDAAAHQNAPAPASPAGPVNSAYSSSGQGNRGIPTAPTDANASQSQGAPARGHAIGQATQMRAAQPMEAPPAPEESHLALASSNPDPIPPARAEPKQGRNFAADPRSFAELVVLASSKRDLVIKNALETDVRLKSFEPGRLEIGLAQGADPSIVQSLSARLKEWTSNHWLVVVSKEPVDAPTLREQADAEKDRAKEMANREPMVQAVMDVFPGATIVGVKNLSNQADPDLEPPQEDDD